MSEVPSDEFPATSEVPNDEFPVDDVLAVVTNEPEIDEEQRERYEHEMERIIRDFVDEPAVQHDVIPESDSDEDDGGREKRGGTHINRGDGRLYFKQTFVNDVAFKESVHDYALQSGRNLFQYRYDKHKLGFKCLGGDPEEEGCKWQAYASILPKDNIWTIRKLKKKHSCTPNGECTLLRVPIIARLFVDKIRDEPDYYKPLKIEELIREKWGITASRDKIQAARCKALKWIDNEYDNQFAWPRDYVAELESSNENSSVELQTILDEEGKDVFNRSYVCFDILRKTWKETCRPIIGVDGTFLKGKIKGQLLVALGRDANNAIYPIAWGVVQVENKDNWIWFVNKLKIDLDLKDGNGYIMVSDRKKGLIRAVELELPKMEHRMCVRHIYGNLKKNHGGKLTMKPFIWALTWSYNKVEYIVNLDKLKLYDMSVYDDVMKSKPETWCRAFQNIGNFCEDVENNPTESFNNTIKTAREKPFVPMLEMVITLAMAQIARRSATSHRHKGICTPHVTKFLAKEYEQAKACKISRSTNRMYLSKLRGVSYRVNLEKRTCTCRKWQICGIPCQHAYEVILDKKVLPEDYVCHWFTTALWRRNYTNGIVPVGGAPFWPPTDGPNVHVPPPPPQPGRNKVTKADQKRKRGINESPSKKQSKETKRIMHCGLCGSSEHNIHFHKKDQNKAQALGSSQVTNSQALGSSQAPGSSQVTPS